MGQRCIWGLGGYRGREDVGTVVEVGGWVVIMGGGTVVSMGVGWV